MKEYIGARPPGGGLGCLQDVHKGCGGNCELFQGVHNAP